jgi:mono/diheme cytochrome c family protein
MRITRLKHKMKLMKKLLIITSIAVAAVSITSCGGGQGNNPGDAYMPDMYYSRAYETYGYNTSDVMLDSLRKRGIHFNGMPVPGTVARGDMFSYRLTADSAGLAKAEGLRNPLDSASIDMREAERLYLINCGICHGPKLDGNGPIYNNGNGGYTAAPPALNDLRGKAWSEGHVFHVVTFGIRQMGSYASQLRPEQRWMVIKYIQSKQLAAKGDTTKTAATTASADTTNQSK